MRILHTEWIRPKGGQSLRVLEDLKIVRELGHTPLLACRPESWLYEEAPKRGFATFAVPFGHLADPKPYFAMLRLIREQQVDIVHTHSSKDSYPATYAAKLLGKKVVRSRHVELTKAPGHLFRLADAVVATGERVRDALIAAGLEPKKVVSIPTYPDPELFAPSTTLRREFRQKHGIGEESLVVGTMAGAGQRKRGWALPKMMIPILEARPDATLLIAGDARSDMAENLQKKIAELGLEKRVHFVGYVRPEAFLNAIDVYACPSEQEGLPQALMQAMMLGKACVSTDVGSIPELNAEENLLLSPRDDLEKFARHLASVVLDDALRKKLGEKNRRLALERFHYGVMKQKTDELYRRLAKGAER